MAITLTGTNGFFKRIGCISGRIQSILNNQGGTSLTAPAISAGSMYTNILAQFASTSAASDLLDGYNSTFLNPSRAIPAEITSFKKLAQNILLRMVNDDVPIRGGYTLPLAWNELLRQMGPAVADSKVAANTVTATAPSAASTNTGSTRVISSVIGSLMPHQSNTQDGSGSNTAMILQHIFPETVNLVCDADAQTGNATQFQERLAIRGPDNSENNPLAWDFTSVYGATATNGSGAKGTLYACDAAVYQNSGLGKNLLNNGDFKTFTAHSPNQWAVVAGVANTDFMDTGGSAASIRGGQCLVLKANASQLVTLTQRFGNSGGTTATLLPNTVYGVSCDFKKDSGSTGTIVLDLVDATPTVINDNNACPNSLTFTIASTGTSYGTGTTYGFFRTPASLPSSYYFRVRTSVHVATADAYLSNLALVQATQLYTGGPYVAAFSRDTANIAGDYYACAFANDYGASSNRVGFQTISNWLFDLRSSGLNSLPIVGSTSIANSFT